LGLTTLQLSCVDCHKIWEPLSPGTLRAGIALQLLLLCAFVCSDFNNFQIYFGNISFTLSRSLSFLPYLISLSCINKQLVISRQFTFYILSNKPWTGSEDSMELTFPDIHEGGKVVSPTFRPPLTPMKYSWCYSC
jgi:hypothetical protein